jgi:hypothetical protein
MLPWSPLGGAISIFSGFVSSALGWAWDKVVQGIFTWFAEGLLLLIEFVWRLLDTATTPRLTDGWFTNGVVAALAPIAVFVTVAMMLMTGIQAALSGRPERIGDAVGSALRALAGAAFTVVVLDTLLQFADLISDTVWQQARPNTRQVLDAIVDGVLGGDGWGATFLGPLALLIGMIGMVVTTVLLFMRSALIYLVAAFAPLVWSTSILPMFRGGVRRMVHIAVALVLAKPAIVISLAIGMQLIAASPLAGDESDSAMAQVGMMLTGFFAFAVASISPWVVYRLLPAAEAAAVGSGIVAGWGRSAMGVAQAGLMAKSMGAARTASAATKAIPSSDAASGSTGFSAPSGGPAGGRGSGGGPSGPAGGSGADVASGPGTAGPAGAPGASAAAAAHPVGTAVAAASTAKQAASGATTAVDVATSAAGSASPSGGAPSDRGAATSDGETRSARRVVITTRDRRGDGEEGGGG